jgi:SAM-dependent methyltransferase
MKVSTLYLENMSEIKKNVNEFNKDVEENKGYKYTTNAKFSSIVSNKRITDGVNKIIPAYVKTLMDVGCGDGTYTNEIKICHPSIKITGVDPSVNAIKIASDKYKNISFSDINIYDADKLAVNKYDLSVFRGVLHHLSDQSLAIKNAALFSDEMIIVEPNGNNFILKWIEKNSQYHIEHEEQSFTTKQLSDWCIENGWDVKSIKYIGYVPFFFPTFPSKIIYFFQPFLELIPVINKYFSAQIILYCKKKK